MDEQSKRRGRPPGSKNKPKEDSPVRPDIRLMPPSKVPYDDYQHPDPMAMVSRLYTECDWALQALHNSLRKGIGAAEGVRISYEDTEKMAKVAASLEKAIVTHTRALKLVKSINEDKTPEEYLALAVNKIKGQTLATVRHIIQDLKAHTVKMGLAKKDKEVAKADAAVAMANTPMQELARQVSAEPDDEEPPDED